MSRGKSVLLIPLALLTACGGGGGKSASLPPVGNSPQSKKTGEATFSFKLPGKTTMTKLKRRYYQSQATQGVAIDWTSSNPYAPDYSAPITAACPIPTVGDSNLPPGVTSCTIDANGDTDYTFQLQVPAGTYPDLTVTTFDQAPASGGTFVASANMLAQGQLAAPVVIVAGTANTIPALTFYGIPASVSFVPGPAQSHVTTYNGSLVVIGNAPQTFFAQAVDADGFAIDSTDGTAPTVTVAEASSDSPQYFNIATTPSAYEFILTAQNGSAGAPAQMVLTATPGGTGLTPITEKLAVTPVQELWTTQEAGSNPNGIYGYALYNGASPAVIDGYPDPVGNALCGNGGGSCNFQIGATDPVSGSINAAGILPSIPAVFAFTQGAASTGLIAPSTASYTGVAGDTYLSMAIDNQHHGFILVNAGGKTALEAYSISASNVWTPLASATANGATAIAVAPPNAAFAAGSVYVVYNGGVYIYTLSGSTLNQVYNNTGPSTAINTTNIAVGFDSGGNLWTSDGSSVYKFTNVTGSSLTLGGTGSLNNSGAYGTSFGAAAGGVMYFGEGTGLYTGFDTYTCSGSCGTISVSGGVIPTNASSFAAFVTP